MTIPQEPAPLAMMGTLLLKLFVYLALILKTLTAQTSAKEHATNVLEDFICKTIFAME